jgi:hypothetical protein
MKKLILGLILTLAQALTLETSYAQIQKPHAKEIEAIKIGYITRRLDLTPEESQKFWPAYNQFQKDLSFLNQQKKQTRIQNANNAEQLIDDDFSFDTKILELRKKYRIKFNQVISDEKVKRLYIAEREFREELIIQLRQRRENKN